MAEIDYQTAEHKQAWQHQTKDYRDQVRAIVCRPLNMLDILILIKEDDNDEH